MKYHNYTRADRDPHKAKVRYQQEREHERQLERIARKELMRREREAGLVESEGSCDWDRTSRSQRLSTGYEA